MEITGTATQKFQHRNLPVPIIILLPEHTWKSPEPQRRDASIGSFEFQSSSYCRNTHGNHRNRTAEIQASEPSSSNHHSTAGTHMGLTGTATQKFEHRNLRVPIIILLPEHIWDSREPQRRNLSIGTFEFQSSSYCRNTYGTHRNRNAEI